MAYRYYWDTLYILLLLSPLTLLATNLITTLEHGLLTALAYKRPLRLHAVILTTLSPVLRSLTLSSIALAILLLPLSLLLTPLLLCH